ncbi:MAG: preprotein translocase subunit SecE [Clostridiales bacterium]|jgi:preprotein translocase subunit SecE|nr:preprotein translocase subunit SecE [Clostridiales bacterium]
MAKNPKNTDAGTSSGNEITVKKSDVGVKANNKSAKESSANSAIAKRRNEIMERRTRALAQTSKNKNVQSGKKDKALKDGEKRPNVFVRAGRAIKRKFKEMWSELKKVTWPEPKEAFKQTLVVLVVVASFLVVLFLMDLGLSNLLKLLIK